LGFTQLYLVLLGFTLFYQVLLGFTGFNRVLLGFTLFYRVLLGFTGFHEAVAIDILIGRQEDELKTTSATAGSTSLGRTMHFVAAWGRFQELQQLLGASLKNIEDRWSAAKGPLAAHFAADEVLFHSFTTEIPFLCVFLDELSKDRPRGPLIGRWSRWFDGSQANQGSRVCLAASRKHGRRLVVSRVLTLKCDRSLVAGHAMTNRTPFRLEIIFRHQTQEMSGPTSSTNC